MYLSEIAEANKRNADPNVGKTYYEINPKDKNQYRTVYVTSNFMTNEPQGYWTNYITGEVPDGMKPIHPLLKSRLGRMPNNIPF